MLRRREKSKFNLLPFTTRMKILRRQSWLLAFLAVLGNLVAVTFLWQFVAPLRAGTDMSDWVEVPTEILESHVIEKPVTDIVTLLFPEIAGVHYIPWIRYGYRYEGTLHIGRTLSPAEETYRTLEGAKARLIHYKTGMTLPCRVNPEFPRDSVLTRHVVPASFQMMLLVAAIALAGANIPLVRKRGEMRRATRQEHRFATFIEGTQPDQDFARFSDWQNELSFEFATATSGDPGAGEVCGEETDAPDSLSGPSLVNKVIEDAIDAAATEVLFQTRDSTLKISYRISGMLCIALEIIEESAGAFREELERLSRLTDRGAASAVLSVHSNGRQYTLHAVSETLSWGERITLYVSPRTMS